MSSDEIAEWIDDMDKEIVAIKREAFRVCWYMRGGVTLTESAYLSYQDREIISDIINENLETTKKSGLPFF